MVAIAVSQDCFLRSTAPTTPGDTGILNVGTLFAFSSSTFQRALIRIPLASLPIGASISAATFTLTFDGGAPIVGAEYTAYRLTQPDWTVAATWNTYDGVNNWDTVGGDFTATNAASVIYASGTTLVFDVLDLLLDAMAAGLTYLDLILVGPEVAGSSSYVVGLSSSTDDEDERPEAEVTYTALTLTVVDNGDGTGATATISGGDVSDVHRIFAGQWGGSLGGVDFSHVASRTGDGTVILPLDAGFYWAVVDSLSNLAYFRVTDDEYSVHYQWLLAVQARIQSLALPGIDSANVVIRKLPWVDIPEVYPSVIISGWQPETIANYSNAREDYGFPAMVSIQEKDNHDLVTNQQRNLLWRQRMITAIVHQPEISGIPEIADAFIEPGPVVLPAAFTDNVYHSSFVARGRAPLPRGI